MTPRIGRRPLPALWAVLASLAIGLLALGAACRQQTAAAGDIEMTMQVLPSPPSVGPAQITVVLQDAYGSPVRAASVEVEGNMNHAGMVPVRASAEPRGDGRYVTRDFRFTMAGDWIITAQVVLSDGKKVERTFDLRGVAGGGMAKPADPAGKSQH